LLDAEAFLWDIERAAAAIAEFIEGKNEQSYAESDVVRSAVERKFEIIGEALGQLARADRALAERIPRYRETIAFRNLLIHGYAAVDHKRVWRIANQSLPPLRSAVSGLLTEIRLREE
jgi:uncharacterized protein with HEPN domain